MTSQRLLLVVGSLLVLGLILGLVYALRADSQPQPTRSSAPPPPPAPVAAHQAPAPRPPVAPTPRPQVATPSPGASDDGIPGIPDDEGRIVRDHRGSPASIPPSPIASDTITAARLALEAPLKACADASPPPAGDPPHIYMHVTLRSAGGRVQATDFSLTGADPMGATYTDCVRQAVEALAVAAPPSQADGQEMIHMPIQVP